MDEDEAAKTALSKTPEIIAAAAKTPRAFASLFLICLIVFSVLVIKELDEPSDKIGFAILAFLLNFFLFCIYLIIYAEKTKFEFMLRLLKVVLNYFKSPFAAILKTINVNFCLISAWVLIFIPLIPYNLILAFILWPLGYLGAKAQNITHKLLTVRATWAFLLALPLLIVLLYLIVLMTIPPELW